MAYTARLSGSRRGLKVLGRFIVVGLGRIGLRVLWDLHHSGHNVVGVDSSYDAVEKARSLGLEASLADYEAAVKLAGQLGGVDAIVTALPGSIGFRAVSTILEAGYNVVDVSFFPEDPWPLREIAVKNGVVAAIDAGVAPGLSNFLVGVLRRRLGAKYTRILVGGVAKKPVDPLGLAATWSVEDLLEEYLRPARYIEKGQLRTVKPLEVVAGEITIDEVGLMEYFPTDGLRTLLTSFPDMELMIEHTLRWPGHLETMKKLAALGFLGEKPLNVGGCPVSPKRCLARLLEARTSNVEDLVVMLVEGGGEERKVRYRLVVEQEGDWTAMARVTAAFQATVAEIVAEGSYEPGLLLPESLGLNAQSSRSVMERLASRRITLVEQLVEEGL